MPWLLATSKPYQGPKAVEEVENLGLRCMLPQFKQTRVVRGRRVDEIVPVFGSYLFVDLTPRWGDLLTLRSIRDVARYEEGPVPIPDRAIDELSSRIDENGFFIMPRKEKGRFRKNARVTPSEGPLQYFVGIYEGATSKDREAALFNMMGASRRIEFATGILLAA